MKDRIAFAFECSLLAVFVAHGQSVTGAIAGSTTGPRTISGSMMFSAPFATPTPITGVPYSAEQHQEHVQTLADGTHITQTQTVQKMWRDSQGRTRNERPLVMLLNAANVPDVPIIVQIQDPVAGYMYVLDPDKKIAHRSAMPASRTSPPNAPPNGVPVIAANGAAVRDGVVASQPAKVQMTSEDLGTQVIEGVVVQGRRTTRTIPTGAQGNDRPLVSTTETWTSRDLRMTVLTKTSDPRNGDTTMQLTNISQAEPDPSLFQPPPDYTIVDEQGEFRISFGPNTVAPPPPPPAR